MSLDVYLEVDEDRSNDKHSGIFIRENEQTREISREEWDKRYPDREPVIAETSCNGQVFTRNITHNLNRMADEAGIYQHLWRPEEIGIRKAEQLVLPLQDGLALLQSDPARFKKLNPSNGWGTYEGLCEFVAEYLAACQRFPDAAVSVWR